MTRLSILVTAGPTYEPIDPVRFISNRSTGAMGVAISACAKKRGHKVYLIGPGENLTTIQMQKKVIAKFNATDAVVIAAAAADYRPEKISLSKIKKSTKILNLKLVKNPDILAGLGKIKKGKILVGFALETENLYKNALGKLKSKKLDFIVANKLNKKQNVFGDNKTSVLIIDKTGDKEFLRNISKKAVAENIIKRIERMATYPSG